MCSPRRPASRESNGGDFRQTDGGENWRGGWDHTRGCRGQWWSLGFFALVNPCVGGRPGTLWHPIKQPPLLTLHPLGLSAAPFSMPLNLLSQLTDIHWMPFRPHLSGLLHSVCLLILPPPPLLCWALIFPGVLLWLLPGLRVGVF